MIKNISTIKALAILSVVAAHVDIKVTNSDLFGALQYFYFAFGSLGVGLFFILAGASFSEKVFKASENYQKIKKYAAPWIISGTAIYIYLYIRKGSPFISYFEYLIGNGSYLYFMSMLSIFLLGGSALQGKRTRQLLLIISLIYIMLSKKIMPPGVSEHLNILLWTPYFLFGFVIAKSKSALETITSPEFLAIILTAALSFVLQETGIIAPSALNYQNPILVFLVCGIFVLLSNSIITPGGDKINIIGRNTLFIYLWHMPFIGIFNYLANNFLIYIHFISPLLVLFLFFLAIVFAIRINLNMKLAKLIGITKV